VAFANQRVALSIPNLATLLNIRRTFRNRTATNDLASSIPTASIPFASIFFEIADADKKRHLTPYQHRYDSKSSHG
jgi:hypothetical protein